MLWQLRALFPALHLLPRPLFSDVDGEEASMDVNMGVSERGMEGMATCENEEPESPRPHEELAWGHQEGED